MRIHRTLATALGLLVLGAMLAVPSRGEDRIDLTRAKELFEKAQRGAKLTPEELDYLKRRLRELQ